MTEPILRVHNLYTSFRTKAGEVQAVRGVSFDVAQGEIVGVVGESGCGKSVSAMSILRVLPQNAFHKKGQVLFMGEDLLKMSPAKMRGVRGSRISMIFQDPMTSLSPLMKVGRQIEEAIRQNVPGVTKQEARGMALDMLRKVRIPDPESRYDCYPHELSGGMRQRVMIAIALSCKPQLIIADEPTTALDVTIQKQILLLLKEMCREMNLSVIFITHDLGVVAELCDRVVVLYGGVVVEEGTIFEIFEAQAHPYTMGLLASIPKLNQDRKKRLEPIPGSPPDLLAPPAGCPFAARCPYARKVCLSEMPEAVRLSDTHYSRCHLLNPQAPEEGNPFAGRRKA